MQISQTVFKLQIYISKKREDIEKAFLSRNHSLIAIPSVGIIACVISCGLIAIGLIVGAIAKSVRSKKQKDNNQTTISSGHHAVQQNIEKAINQTKVKKELTTQNVDLYKSIQNTQQVMNLNNLSNSTKIGF